MLGFMQKSLGERVLRPEVGLSVEQLDVFRVLFNRRELLKAGQDPARDGETVVFIFPSGVERNVFGAGFGLAMEDSGLNNTADHLVGLSSGAANAGFLAGDQAHLGPDIYGDLANKEFSEFFPPKLNIPFMDNIFRQGPKALNLQNVLNSRSKLTIGLTNMTDPENIRPEYVRIGEHNIHQLVDYISATCSIPGISEPININGQNYADGALTCRNPIYYAIEQLSATKILFWGNRPLREKERYSSLLGLTKLLGEYALLRAITKDYPPEIAKAIAWRNLRSDERKTTKYPADVSIAYAAPKEHYPKITHSRSKIESVARAGEEYGRAVIFAALNSV